MLRRGETLDLFSRAYSVIVARRLGACGPKLQIGYPATIKNPGSVSVGGNVMIREHAWCNCEQHRRYVLHIGSGCYVGRFVHINASRSVVIEADARLEARIATFELAFRMQASAPKMFDLSAESAKTMALYGVGESEFIARPTGRPLRGEARGRV